MKKKIIYKGATYILAGRYRLEVKYPAKNDWDEKIEKAVGTDMDDSGMGMGTRDLGFSFPTEAAAEKALEKIEKLKLKGVNCIIDPE